ncbi:MAG: hypothetical protein [Caudoviricetes sp.]|nr:MAG: hypothetical protein [Caudoviricetes sp.]
MLQEKLSQISKESNFKEKGSFGILSEAILTHKGTRAKENFDSSNTVFKKILLDRFYQEGRIISKVSLKLSEEFPYEDKQCIPERVFVWVNRDNNSYGNFVKGLTFMIEDLVTRCVQFSGDVLKIQNEIDKDNDFKNKEEEETQYQFDFDFDDLEEKPKSGK